MTTVTASGSFDPGGVAPLLAALDDADESVRLAALRAAVRLPLTAEAWREVGRRVREALAADAPPTDVIEAAAYVPLREVRQRLRELLQADTQDTRRAAAHSLARARDPAALDTLLAIVAEGLPRWWQPPRLRAGLRRVAPWLPLPRAQPTLDYERDLPRLEAALSLTQLEAAGESPILRTASAADPCAETRLFAGVALARAGRVRPLLDALDAVRDGTAKSVGGDPVELASLYASIGPLPLAAKERLEAKAATLGGQAEELAHNLLAASRRAERSSPPRQGADRIDEPAADPELAERRRRAAAAAEELAASTSPPVQREDWYELSEELLETLPALDAATLDPLITRLFERAAADEGMDGILLGNWLMTLLGRLRRPLRPDVRALLRATRGAGYAVASQAAWTISQAELPEVVATLQEELASTPRAEERRHAAWMIENAVRYAGSESGPMFGGGAGPADVPVGEIEFIDEGAFRSAESGDQPLGREDAVPASRFVNTWLEGPEPLLPLVVGRPTSLHLQIGPRRDRTPGGGATPFAEPDWGDRTRLELVVSLYSRELALAPRHQRLVLPRFEPSTILTWEVTPRRPGRCRLRIVISLARELELLQTLHLELEAAATAVAPAAAATGGG